MVLGHHYQRDQVIALADARGDSFELARQAAVADAPYIVFCGVRFMAESASVLARPDQTVILPDLAAGCSMADMAEGSPGPRRLGPPGTRRCRRRDGPADLHELDRRHQGLLRRPPRCDLHLLERPDGHALGLRTGDGRGGERRARCYSCPISASAGTPPCSRSASSLDDCVVYDPWQTGRRTDRPAAARRPRRSCGRGTARSTPGSQPEMVDALRAGSPDVEVLVHPECRHEVVQRADRVGIDRAADPLGRRGTAGATLAVATELNLVKRLADERPDKRVVFLDDTVCFCATMNRIDLPHVTWVLESLVAGEVVNEVRVDDTVRRSARVALERMLALPAEGHRTA